MGSAKRPPPIVRWLLRRLLEGEAAEVVAGDLEESWLALRRESGPTRARLWYWRNALGSIAELRATRPFRRRPKRGGSTVLRPFDDLRSDLAYSLRLLRRSPGYVVAALLVLALGIGANTALFTVVRSVLWQPLPYAEPERLGLLRISVGGIDRAPSLSAPELEDFRERASLLEGTAAQWTGWSVLDDRDQAQRVRSTWITANLFPLLGTAPALGRSFTAEEEDPEGPNQVAILSHELWQRSFEGDPEIVGRTLQLDGRARTVVGVMPPGFRMMLNPRNTNRPDSDLWIPNTYWVERDVHWLRAVVRLRDGATFEQAQAEVDAITERLNAEHPEYADNPVTFNLDPLQSELVAAVEPALLVLGVTVLLILLMACANVAALALARAHGRAGEIAVRSALGASRWRLARQVLTEHVMLGVLAGGLGVLLARWAIHALVLLRPPTVPRIDEIRFDGDVVALAFALALATLLLVGSVPAWRLSHGATLRGLQTAARGALGRREQRGRRLLVTGQIAAALVLAILTGLLLRSLQSVYDVDLGFRPEGVTVARLNIPVDVYDTPQSRIVFLRQLEQALASHREVDSVGSSNLTPLAGGLLTGHFETEQGPGGFEVDLRVVTSGYLETLGARLVEGRFLSPEDVEQSRAMAVVDVDLAETLWPGERAVGRRLKTGLGTNLVWHEVVGVVEHLRYEGVREEGRPQVHLPYQAATPLTLVVSSPEPTARIAGVVREAVRQLDRGAPVSDIRSLGSYVRDDVADLTFALSLMSLFAALALLLALVGIYGVIAYWVNGSIRTLGVHMALGAVPGDLLRLVLRQGAMPATLGALLGLAGAYALARLGRSLLFGVDSIDAATYVTATLTLLVAAIVACLVPGLRAARIDPSQALRSE